MEQKKLKWGGVEVPKSSCDDKNCFYHGSLSLRGRSFVGRVIRANAQKTVVVEWNWLFYISKYERYERRRSRVQAHLAPCLDVKVGDKVKIVECRPLSKTKHFVVVGRVK